MFLLNFQSKILFKSYKTALSLIIIFSLIGSGCVSLSTSPEFISIIPAEPISNTSISSYLSIKTLYESDKEIVLAATWRNNRTSENHTLKWELVNSESEVVFIKIDENYTIRPRTYNKVKVPLSDDLKKKLTPGDLTFNFYVDDVLALSTKTTYVPERMVTNNSRKVVILPFIETCDYPQRWGDREKNYFQNTMAIGVYGEIKRLFPNTIPHYVAGQKLEENFEEKCHNKSDCGDYLNDLFGDSILIFGTLYFQRVHLDTSSLTLSIYDPQTNIKRKFHFTQPYPGSFSTIMRFLLEGALYKKGAIDYLSSLRSEEVENETSGTRSVTEPTEEIGSLQSDKAKDIEPQIAASDDQYIRYTNGIVEDKVTGLELYFYKFDGLGRFAAQKWASNLKLNGGNWRLASYKELQGLYNNRLKSNVLRSSLRISQKYVWYNESLTERFNFTAGNATQDEFGDSAASAYAIAVRPRQNIINQNSDLKTQKNKLNIKSVRNNKPQIAIFPFFMTNGDAKYWAPLTIIDAIKQLKSDTNSFDIKYSHFDFNNEFMTRHQIEKIDNIKAVTNKKYSSKDVWIYNNVNSKPKVEVVCEIAKSLGIDLVLMGLIDVSPMDPPNGTACYFLIDVQSKMAYVSKGSTSEFGAYGFDLSLNNLENVFNQYNSANRRKKVIHKDTVQVVSNKALDEAAQIVDKNGRYIKYANGIVYDQKTNLEWYAISERGIGWYQADSWSRGLKLKGGNWRMPTLEECQSLYKNQKGENVSSFLKILDHYVWCSDSKGSYFKAPGSGDWPQSDFAGNGNAFAVRFRE